MKPLTVEWVVKAEGDFLTLQREWRARKNPNYDALCFHAQQCAEKYLKACLQEKSLQIEKTHNLETVLNAIIPIAPLFEVFRETLKRLTNYAVAFRYPGETATREDARNARNLCASVRTAVRLHLGCHDE